MIKRKRATVIVETPNGILLVSHSKKRNPEFMLPGGGVKGREQSIVGAIRELREETGLRTRKIEFLFTQETKFHKHKVFRAETFGRLRKRNETQHISYWNKRNKDKIKVARHVPLVLKKV